VPAGQVLPSTRHRLLPDPGVRAVCADRDPVLGVVLDQHGVVAGSSIHRSADRAHDVDDEWRRQSLAAESLLHQGKTRLK